MSSELGLLTPILPISLPKAGTDSPLPTGFLGSSRSYPHLGQEGRQRTVATDHISELKDKGVRDASACLRNAQHWFEG